MTGNLEILIVDDDASDLTRMKKLFSGNQEKFTVHVANNFQKASKLLTSKNFDLAFIDFYLGKDDSLPLIQNNHSTPVVIVTGNGNHNTVVTTLKSGAYDYLIKDSENLYLGRMTSIAHDFLSMKKYHAGQPICKEALDELIKTLHCFQAKSEQDSIQLLAKTDEERKRLQQATITLVNIVRLLESDTRCLKEQYREIITGKIIPLIASIKSGNGQTHLIDRLRESLECLMGVKTSIGIDPRLQELTPTEIKICHHLKAGKSIKEVAAILDMAITTAYGHTRTIRKKFAVSGNKQNLATYLSQNFSDL